jgi:hypothetical protein
MILYFYAQRVLFSHDDKNNNCGVSSLFSSSFYAVATVLCCCKMSKRLTVCYLQDGFGLQKLCAHSQPCSLDTLLRIGS